MRCGRALGQDGPRNSRRTEGSSVGLKLRTGGGLQNANVSLSDVLDHYLVNLS